MNVLYEGKLQMSGLGSIILKGRNKIALYSR
jgi:hypothetical protein